MKSEVYFADEKLRKTYEALAEAKTEKQLLHKWITQAIIALTNNAFCGTAIPKTLIPKIYFKNYKIDNLWKYDLPQGWRLIYSVGKKEIQIVTIILEWFTHKEYEKRFKY
ncbi:MAG: hypothetical protein KKF46_00625 [Nanoarchaeota archaeon]|nr:hypothetical protein [Nanoarchaeota archaeon]MBU1320839.1 hypothetical protein [Nanoarchaeota archaeon]MBU1598062.1 hypothetical protein [Nanoarchaeota archaeon]MBU2441487.1 hypothetical protein [Nanoarchaeota archaeon]